MPGYGDQSREEAVRCSGGYSRDPQVSVLPEGFCPVRLQAPLCSPGLPPAQRWPGKQHLLCTLHVLTLWLLIHCHSPSSHQVGRKDPCVHFAAGETAAQSGPYSQQSRLYLGKECWGRG